MADGIQKKWDSFLKDERFAEINGFDVRDHLEPGVWPDNSGQIDPHIKERLLEIVKNFLKGLDMEDLDVKDVVLTGSLANYNWSKYSDFDLHVIVDFDDVDENTELVRDYFNTKKSNWNNKHEIRILGYEVEIYIENQGEPHTSTGIYSLVNNKWLTKPYRAKPKIDWSGVYGKAAFIADEIDRVSRYFDKQKYEKAFKTADRVKEKIRKFRKCGLEEAGQYSSENLAFKLLRRSDYLQKLSSLRIVAYDRMMSIKNQHKRDLSERELVEKWKDFLR
mgnify:CR=1 FL=1